MKIFKFPILIKDKQEILMPSTCRIIHVGLDPNGVACVWAEVDFVEEKSKQIIYVIGTGEEIPKDVTDHLGSFVQGPFVWHIYW